MVSLIGYFCSTLRRFLKFWHMLFIERRSIQFWSRLLNAWSQLDCGLRSHRRRMFHSWRFFIFLFIGNFHVLQLELYSALSFLDFCALAGYLNLSRDIGVFVDCDVAVASTIALQFGEISDRRIRINSLIQLLIDTFLSGLSSSRILWSAIHLFPLILQAIGLSFYKGRVCGPQCFLPQFCIGLFLSIW